MLSNTVCVGLQFAPWLELHHIVVLTDPNCVSKGCYTVDFSPADYSNPKTLGKMILGQDVKGEIRVRWIAGESCRCYTFQFLSFITYIINLDLF